MSFRSSLSNPLHPSDLSGSLWDSPDLDLWLHPGGQSAAPPPPTPVVLPAETYEAQAAMSASGSGGPGSVVAETSGGLTINLIFDAAAMAAPASFRAGIEQAAAILSSAISDKITLNFNIDYSGTGGGAAAGPDGGEWVNYSTVRADLVNNASAGDTAFNALPTGSTIQGQSSVAVWNAQLKLWGLLGANDTTTDDGTATFATDINPNLLVGVALHELTHAMGRAPYGTQPDVFDFYRFTSPGVRLFTDNIPASAAYFSLDGGTTKIVDYGQNSDPSDFLNSGVQGGNDPFNEYYTNTTLQQLTGIDLKQLDALGFHLASQTPVVIQTDGTTSLVQVGSSYFLDVAGGGAGPQLTRGGSPVTDGEYGTWTPISAVQVAGGYDVAWKDPGSGLYTVWSTDVHGNYITNLISGVPGNSASFEAFETTFNKDLNGDGSIGIPARVIHVDGSIALTEVGNNFYLYDNGSGPELQRGGAAVTDGEYGTWTVIDAVQVSGGYDVAWKDPSSGLYTVWSTDSNGNYLANLIGAVPGNSTSLETLETTFNQDLNGDGSVGIPTRVIQTDISTALTEIGNHFYLYNGGSGPELQRGGAAVTDGEYGTWTPIGAVQVAGGYDVAWKDPASGLYTVWSTDSSGNYLANVIPGVSGTSTALEALETTFHQDLNGDGTIGIPTAPAAAQAMQTSFDGQTLTLDTPAAFSGQLVGFGGDGTPAASDQVDLRGFNFDTLHTSFDGTAGTLSLSSGSKSASLQFLGQYSQDSFHFADDGNGGTLVVATTPAAQAAAASENSNFAAHDTFVFVANFGNVTLPSFTPATDTLQFSKTVFASLSALLAATHDDGSGNAVITDAAHDTITLQHVTSAQLIAHQSDFHFV